MPIELDRHTAIRNPHLGRLVGAVVEADAHDEADWIEWKSSLDLSTKRGCFTVARTILGMSNRMPAAAALICEGLGYIVVGAEPGNLVGVVSVDPADLDQILEPWLGGFEGPRYTPTYVHVEGKKVLVVVVEAPHAGDPVYTLRKEYDGYRDGDVFVRKSGRTDRANSSDVKALVQRASTLSTAPPDIDVSLVGDLPLSWLDAAAIDSVVASWIGDRRKEMESAARAEERLRNPQPTSQEEYSGFNTTALAMADVKRQQQLLARVVGDASRAMAIAGLASEPDKRTLDEYFAEVETWCERARAAAPGVILDRYLREGHGLIAVRVHNPSGRFLPSVRVEVHFEWDRVTSPELEWPEKDLPAEPRRYGEPTPSALAQSMSFSPSSLASMFPILDNAPTLSRSWTEEGSVKIVFNLGDLRQEDTDTSEDHYLLLPERPPGGKLHGTWKATVPAVHGVIRGDLEVLVCDQAVELQRILDARPGHDEP